jgi:hypothetical protein
MATEGLAAFFVAGDPTWSCWAETQDPILLRCGTSLQIDQLAPGAKIASAKMT